MKFEGYRTFLAIASPFSLKARIIIIIIIIIRVYKNHLKMVKRCRIDIGLCKKDPPKTHGTRVICETGVGLGGQRARRA